MNANVGKLDRVLRVLLGLGLIAFGLLATGPWRWLGLAGPVLLLTAAAGFCPAYWLLRIKTVLLPASK